MRDADHCLSGLLASHGISQGNIGGGWSIVLSGTSQRANHPSNNKQIIFSLNSQNKNAIIVSGDTLLTVTV